MFGVQSLCGRQGVMLSHGNLLAVVAGQLLGMDKMGEMIERPGDLQRFTPDDVMISYLPLAHIFDRCVRASAAVRRGFSCQICVGTFPRGSAVHVMISCRSRTPSTGACGWELSSMQCGLANPVAM